MCLLAYSQWCNHRSTNLGRRIPNGMGVKIRLALELRRKGRDWIALCPGIDVASQAPTKRGALYGIREAIELWFESCIARNVLSEALSDAGFNKTEPGEAVPEGTPNIVMTTSTRKSAPGSTAAESPTFNFKFRKRSGQRFLEGFIPKMLERGGPYSHASFQVD